MKVAVEGCCHGELDAIYGHIQSLETQKRYKVDVLLICGDFEAIRDSHDLKTMAVPEKYRHMGDFHKYYTGQATAPLLTLVIGGNHEASNHLWELYHGGWLAPNIYFLGHAGCVQVNGVRIAGASGIFKQYDYRSGHFERQPYDHSAMRSICHIREYNVRRLALLSSPDVFLSHDWPSGITQHGDLDDLLRRKPHHHRNALPQPGNPDEITLGDEGGLFDAPSSGAKVFSASAAPQNPDEITLDDEIETVEPPPPPPRETRFLALDKCLPRRQFLEVVDIPAQQGEAGSPSEGASQHPPVVLSYDPEWLAITRAFQPYLSRGRKQETYPDPDSARAAVSREWDWVHAHVQPKLGDGWRVDACQRFARGANSAHQQTEAFATLLEMENLVR
ncbi:lariat debranching enzyme, C-terminal domain-containing protein [Russula earlei]|uniref:Lariat debranching enzyme, C-terminal domain-containing protein n=1 Tax=Russula earlei TaxID=71964 RepID=A0ACC0TXN9_9AGAM|nr:lariat debranching enzyme, C-terminal domain-containing protein [Russula earlei]